jgi:hypothetical protein
MKLDLSNRELAWLAGHLETTCREKFHQLHHAGTSDYKKKLRDEITLLEDLLARMQQTVS